MQALDEKPETSTRDLNWKSHIPIYLYEKTMTSIQIQKLPITEITEMIERFIFHN